MREATLPYDFTRSHLQEAAKQLRPGPGEQLEFYGEIPSGLVDGIRPCPGGKAFMGMPWVLRTGCPKIKVRRV